jgi:hypothetical protein
LKYAECGFQVRCSFADLFADLRGGISLGIHKLEDLIPNRDLEHKVAVLFEFRKKNIARSPFSGGQFKGPE